MQVLVISDSHGDSAIVRQLLEKYKHRVQTVVHLGDNVKDLLQFDADYPAINFVVVAGNCDYYAHVPKDRMLTLGGRRVLLLHGHTLDVKSGLDRLMFYAQEKGADACLFGHSHMPFMHRREPVFSYEDEKPPGCLFMNPGSVSEPRGGSKAGYGLLSIDKGNITGELIEL